MRSCTSNSILGHCPKICPCPGLGPNHPSAVLTLFCVELRQHTFWDTVPKFTVAPDQSPISAASFWGHFASLYVKFNFGTLSQNLPMPRIRPQSSQRRSDVILRRITSAYILGHCPKIYPCPGSSPNRRCVVLAAYCVALCHYQLWDPVPKFAHAPYLAPIILAPAPIIPALF